MNGYFCLICKIRIERGNFMNGFEITPCIYYLADKDLEEQECLKLFVFYGEIFSATPEIIERFTNHIASAYFLYPRSFKSDEIKQMKNRIIKPHAKRVNPYGCYDITRYGTFFNINVPKCICQGCPYSVLYKNARKNSEKLLIAAILNKLPIPNKIKIQMELSGSKAANTIMPSVFTVQGKEKNISKFDIIELNAFLLKYLLSNYNLVTLESKNTIIGYIKNGFKSILLKDMELNNTFEYVFEMLCRELLDISDIDVNSENDGKKISDIAEEITLPYEYDRRNAIDTARNKIIYNDNIPIQPATGTIPVIIEPVEIPIAANKIDIIDKNLILPFGSQNKTNSEKCITEEEELENIHDDKKSQELKKNRLCDPERYYPVNYEVDSEFASKNINIIDEYLIFPFLEQVNSEYMISIEKCSLRNDNGLLIYDNNGKYYFYRFCQTENRPLKELMRRRPLLVTMNSVELHAALREHRIYEHRTADLKDMYVSLNPCGNLPHTFRLLFEKMSGENLSDNEDFYISALKYYKNIYQSYLKKIFDNNVLEDFKCYTAVSAAIGCSWHTNGIFEGIADLYERKTLFEYHSICPKEISAKIPGSFYCYQTDDSPAKNEKFYSELVHELVKMESIKLGKVIILNISDKGLFLFAFETCGITYELLQWPCVYFARELNIKKSHVHYYRQVYVPNDNVLQPESSENAILDKKLCKNVFNMDLC